MDGDSVHQRDTEEGADLERRGLGGEASGKKVNLRSKYLSLMYQQDLSA